MWVLCQSVNASANKKASENKAIWSLKQMVGLVSLFKITTFWSVDQIYFRVLLWKTIKIWHSCPAPIKSARANLNLGLTLKNIRGRTGIKKRYWITILRDYQIILESESLCLEEFTSLGPLQRDFLVDGYWREEAKETADHSNIFSSFLWWRFKFVLIRHLFCRFRQHKRLFWGSKLNINQLPADNRSN